MVDEAETQWSDGSLVTLMWHECPPTMSEPCDWTQVESQDGALSTAQWQQLTTPGTSLYQAWVNELGIIVPYLQQLKSAGIDLQVQSESAQQFTNTQDNGDFQLLIDNFGYTPSAYSYYYNLLDSSLAPKTGTPDTIGNFGSYSNAQVDADLVTIAGTTDTAVQKTAFSDIEKHVVDDIPDIPLFEQQNEQEFNGGAVSGYPTKSNPYASAAIYMQPDVGWVMMRLAPAR